MINKDLLAATAVFAELVNKDIDYKEVINNFIFSIYNLEKKYSMNSQEICAGLSNHYDFNIPEAVIKIQLNTLFKKDKIDYINGNYIVTPEIIKSNSEITNELKKKNHLQNKIFEDLIKYIEIYKGKLDDEIKDEINIYFVNYLFDDSFNGDYSELVSNFILKNSDDENFKNELNLIREGIIILRGFKYSADVDENGVLKNELNIYLDTEHLFSINGYNGDIHKKILFDFYNIVRELNTKQTSKKIFLKYFGDAKNEIKYLFLNAIDIFEKKKTKGVSSEATKYILNGVIDKSDILRKETQFFSNLKTMGIEESEDFEIPEEQFLKYNVETNEILEKYSTKYEEKDVIKIMQCFSKINFLRKGKNKNILENIGHILVSGDSLTRKISKDSDSKIENSDFSFATDIYYITNRLWFKNNKGFGFKGKLPTTLDVVSKAQVILSNKLINVIRERFEFIKKDVETGVRSEEEVKSFYASLVTKSLKPEDINSGNIDEKIKILFDYEDIDSHIRQETLLREKLKDLEDYKQKNETLKKLNVEKKKKEEKEERNKKALKFNSKIETKILVIKCLYFVIPLLLSFIIIYFRYKDNIWDIIDTIIYIIPFLFWLIGFKKIKDRLIQNEKAKIKVLE